MNKSHLVVGVLAAAVVVAGVSAIRSSQSTSPANSLASPEGAMQDGSASSVVVVFSDKGFTPSVVKVKRGASIDFLNMSGKALRIAPLKDPADGSSAYLGFAASKSIGRNQSFGVSVTQPGIWGYKSLNDPNIVGVVIVE